MDGLKDFSFFCSLHMGSTYFSLFLRLYPLTSDTTRGRKFSILYTRLRHQCSSLKADLTKIHVSGRSKMFLRFTYWRWYSICGSTISTKIGIPQIIMISQYLAGSWIMHVKSIIKCLKISMFILYDLRKPKYPGKTRPVARHWQTLSPRHEWVLNSQR
jgi:hypothetical protein